MTATDIITTTHITASREKKIEISTQHAERNIVILPRKWCLDRKPKCGNRFDITGLIMSISSLHIVWNHKKRIVKLDLGIPELLYKPLPLAAINKQQF